MGIQESREDAQPVLKLLRDIPHNQYEKALSSLEMLTKQKFQMQISKWDILMVIPLKPIEVKKIIQMLTMQQDPQQVSIHQMMCALILSRENMGAEAKIVQLINSICFELEPGKLQESEVMYLFHIIYNQIEACSGFKLQDSKLERHFMQSFFSGGDLVAISSLAQMAGSNPDVIELFKVFTKNLVLGSPKLSVGNHEQPPEIILPQDETANLQSDSPSKTSPKKSSHSNTRNAKGDPSATSSRPESQLMQPSQNQLDWNQNILSQVQSNYSNKIVPPAKSIVSMEKMTGKLFQIRKENVEDITSNSAQHIIELSKKFEQIEKVSQDFYGTRQLTYMMKSLFFEQELVLSNMSIQGIIRESAAPSTDSQVAHFEEVMTRAQTAATFKEFFKQNLSQLQYEQKMHQQRLVYFFIQRGERRILEKKKFKALGEISKLCGVLDMMEDKKRLIEEQKAAMKREEELQAKLAMEIDETKQMLNNVVSSEHLSPEQMQQKQGSTKKEKILTKVVPDIDEIYREIYETFSRLRNCNMSRRDLMLVIQLKEKKALFKKILSFWEGVLRCLKVANQVKAFSELEYFKDFKIFAEDNLKEEQINYKRHIADQQSAKDSLLRYSTHIGSLKGLAMVLQILDESPKMTEKDLAYKIQSRIQKLLQRVQNVDLKIIKSLSLAVSKKRSQKLYFEAMGQISAYKCISKGISFEHTLDYMAIGLFKLRTWESITLCCQAKTYRREKYVSSADLLSSTQKMCRLIELDNYFNLEHGSQESQGPDYVKFIEDLQQIEMEEKLSGQAPQVPYITPIDKVNAITMNKSFSEVVTSIVEKFYDQHRASDFLKRTFTQFIDSGDRFSDLGRYETVGTMTFRTEDIEAAAKVFFDFISIEDIMIPDGKPDDLCAWMASLSCSIEQCYFHDQIENLKQDKAAAHLSAETFAKELQSINEQGFLNQFKAARPSVVLTFVNTLCKANKEHFLNNFDVQILSMPLEHSLQNNFRSVQALHLRLHEMQRASKFEQLVCAQSGILLSKRSQFLSLRVAQQLILAAFQLGPANPFADGVKQEVDEEDSHQKDKDDFDAQFKMTMGLETQEYRVKQKLFGELEELLSQVNTQTTIEQKVCYGLIQDKEENKIESLEALIQFLYQLSQDPAKVGDINQLVNQYQEVRMDYLENLKSKAIVGIFKGGKEFLENLIMMQTSNNSYGKNQTMIRFKEQMAQVFKTVSSQFEDMELKNSPRNKSGKANSKKSSDYGPSNITVTSPTGSEGSPKRKKSSSPKKKKKQTQVSPMVEIEQEVIGFFAKSSYIYELIKMAHRCKDLEEFYQNLEERSNYKEEYRKRLHSVIEYLSTNTKPLTHDRKGNVVLLDKPDYQPICEQELGCRIMQDVQAGTLVNAVYVYNPMTPVIKLSEVATTEQATSLRGDEPSNVPEQVELDEPINQLEGEKAVDAQKRELSAQQKAANYLLQFLNQVCNMDDKLTAKQILKNDGLFGYLQIMRLQLNYQETEINLLENTKKGLMHLINIYEVQKTPLQLYIKNYERICKFIQRDLMSTIQKTDESHLKFYFFDVMSQKGSALPKQILNKVDQYFSLADLDDADKLDFCTAQTKIKRELDQSLRTFKEFIDLEENRKVAQSHQSLIRHQELRLVQEIASLILLVRIFYLKQEQIVGSGQRALIEGLDTIPMFKPQSPDINREGAPSQ